MERERLIFHIDVNSAFLSWESVYRLNQDKNAVDLRTIPSAVGGDVKSRHGVVLAKSTPAKRYGITTGEPLVSAYKKCPQLVVVPSRFDFYIQCSNAMMELLSQYTPDHEKFSIDETFLDMTETIHLFGSPLETADQIRSRIYKELGFTVNVGIAPNKLLAKMASDFEKPDKCHTLFTEEIPDKLWPLPIRDLFFVGSSAQKRMNALGIHTIGQLAACDPRFLKPHLGEKYSVLIHQYANGIDDSPVGEREPVNKGSGNSLTLSRDVSDLETARQVLLSLCETVGARLRAAHVLCNCVCVELKTWDFCTQSHQATLLSPTDSTSQIYEKACQILEEFWDLTPVRLIGVRTTKIAEEGSGQISFFDTAQDQKKREFEKAVDEIRSRFGVDSIKRASFLSSHAIADHASGKQKHFSKDHTHHENTNDFLSD